MTEAITMPELQSAQEVAAAMAAQAETRAGDDPLAGVELSGADLRDAMLRTSTGAAPTRGGDGLDDPDLAAEDGGEDPRNVVDMRSRARGAAPAAAQAEEEGDDAPFDPMKWLEEQDRDEEQARAPAALGPADPRIDALTQQVQALIEQNNKLIARLGMPAPQTAAPRTGIPARTPRQPRPPDPSQFDNQAALDAAWDAYSEKVEEYNGFTNAWLDEQVEGRVSKRLEPLTKRLEQYEDATIAAYIRDDVVNAAADFKVTEPGVRADVIRDVMTRAYQQAVTSGRRPDATTIKGMLQTEWRKMVKTARAVLAASGKAPAAGAAAGPVARPAAPAAAPAAAGPERRRAARGADPRSARDFFSDSNPVWGDFDRAIANNHRLGLKPGQRI